MVCYQVLIHQAFVGLKSPTDRLTWFRNNFREVQYGFGVLPAVAFFPSGEHGQGGFPSVQLSLCSSSGSKCVYVFSFDCVFFHMNAFFFCPATNTQHTQRAS